MIPFEISESDGHLPDMEALSAWMLRTDPGEDSELESHIVRCKLCQAAVDLMGHLWPEEEIITVEQARVKLEAVGIKTDPWARLRKGKEVENIVVPVAQLDRAEVS